MLDPNVVAQSPVMTVAVANAVPSAEDSSATSLAAGTETEGTEQPFAAILQRHLGVPRDVKMVKAIKDLLHAQGKSDAKAQDPAAATDPQAMLAWLSQLFGSAAPAAADARAIPAADAALAEDVGMQGPGVEQAAAVALAAPVSAATVTADAAESDPAAAAPGPANIAAVARQNPASVASPVAQAAVDGPAATPAHEMTPGHEAVPIQSSAILAASTAAVAESAAQTGNGGNPLQPAAQAGAHPVPNPDPAAMAAHLQRPAASAAPATATVTTVATPVGAQGWSNEVGDRLNWMVSRQETRADLVLNPPQMGRIEVSLSLNGNQANAIFISANPAVREALENAVPQLREILNDAGISLGQAHVGAESFPQRTADGRENDDNSRRGEERAPNALTGTLAAAGPALRRGHGLVDTFA